MAWPEKVAVSNFSHLRDFSLKTTSFPNLFFRSKQECRGEFRMSIIMNNTNNGISGEEGM